MMIDPLAVGGLLYCPATNAHVADHILAGDWPCLTAVSLCLEDSIQESGLEQAEKQLALTLEQLSAAGAKRPLIFVRVRSPRHMQHIHELLGSLEDVLTGYILPKFDLTNGRAYLELISDINFRRERQLYVMPILESKQIASVLERRENLRAIRQLLDQYRSHVLNVRVGGNDFCNLYGLRRTARQTIYDLGVVRDTLIDILNVFADEYVVSGPVWEYYGSDPSAPWAEGLRRELELDRANGFMGKTAIHPSQLPLIHRSLMVAQSDYDDALSIMNWDDTALGVAASRSHRMNEVNCHSKWALRILSRAELYGIRED